MKKSLLFVRGLLYPIAPFLFPCRVMDKDKYQKFDNGQLIITNHLSWMDVAYEVFWIPGYKRFLSKKENEGKGIKRWFLKKVVGVIFVNRDKPELSSMREVISSLQGGEALTVFPEGTRNKVDRSLQPLHSGSALFALRSGVSIVPIVVHHKGKFFKRNYLGVGDRVYLDDLVGKRVDEATLEKATERFREAMQKTLDKLDDWVERKGWKEDKKRKKEEKRQLKKMYKLAKRDYAASKNSK